MILFLATVKTTLAGFVQILVIHSTVGLHSMNVKDPQGPRQRSNQLYQILKAFFKSLCDFQITAIYMLNKVSYIFPHSLLSPGDFYGRCRMVNKVNCKLSFSAHLDCTAHNFNNLNETFAQNKTLFPSQWKMRFL